MSLSLSEVKVNFSKVDFTKLPKPSRNKGDRGQLLELALGIPNSSNLTDMVDGELKTYTRGESIAVTQLKHVLPEIFDKIPFSQTKVGKKLQQTLYVGFDRDNNFLDSITLSREVDLRHYQELEEDFNLYYRGNQIQIQYWKRIIHYYREKWPLTNKDKRQ